MSDLVARARAFATEAHERIDQRRKYTNQPYQEHLKAVAELVRQASSDAEMIAAAWLHDTVEDTPATFGDIEREFGPAVRALVADLTDISKPGDGNREVRKAIDRRHTAQASSRAKTVKLADVIDNCRDICQHDAGFGRIYLGEAAALLEVLGDGDERLFRQAQQTLAKCARRLGLPEPLQSQPADQPWRPEQGPFGEPSLAQRRVFGVFTRSFTARDIACPLRSFDLERPAADLQQQVQAAELEVAGLRQNGVCVGYVRPDARPGRAPEDSLRAFRPEQVLRGDAHLSEVVRVLTRHDFCFVTAMGDVAGVITRGDMQSPIVRMWLFGIITFVELEFAQRIRSRWPAGDWTRLLSEGRLKKAQTLLEERRRRGQHVDLTDCLQLSDKAQVVMSDDQERFAFGLPTKGAAKRVMRDLESLRNNLAHAQDIITHDWPQIARMAARVEEIINRGHRDPSGI